MRVYEFRIDRSKTGECASGMAIVAAEDEHKAWTLLEQELGWESEFFSPDKFNVIPCLSYTLQEPSVITYNVYVE